MVAPASVNSNTNTATHSDGVEQFTTQYESNAGAWVTYAGLNPNTDVLVNAIAASESHGLNTERYQLRSLEQELESFVDNS